MGAAAARHGLPWAAIRRAIRTLRIAATTRQESRASWEMCSSLTFVHLLLGSAPRAATREVPMTVGAFGGEPFGCALVTGQSFWSESIGSRVM